MRKMKKVLGAVLIVLMAVSFAYAEVDKPLHIYLQGGATLPMGDTKDGFKTGFNAGGGVGFSINENIEIVGRVLYHSMKPDFGGDFWLGMADGYNLDDYDASGGELQPLMYGGELKLNTGDEEKNFYLIAGIGKAKLKLADLKVNGEKSKIADDETETYFCVGGGVEFGKFFVEGRYVMIKLKPEGTDEEFDFNMVPICIGVKF
ncbi:MAG: porin family protein [Proteobacteria bacterium]|nr:porin family protein [Pseudomonadota bacterium]